MMKSNEYFEKEYGMHHINDVVDMKDLKITSWAYIGIC